MGIPIDYLLNDFAFRSFCDIADGDYIAARFACRAHLVVQYQWASQQAIEKYIKCILLLNRIPATKVKHNLSAGLDAIDGSDKLSLDLSKRSRQFIQYLDTRGKYRYLEISNIGTGHDLFPLDLAVWELRKFCTTDSASHRVNLRDGFPPPKVRLPGRRLEEIIDSSGDPAREPLLWHNAFFGKKVRRTVKAPGWLKGSNSPLFLNPEILDEVIKYIYLPEDLIKAYRNHKKP